MTQVISLPEIERALEEADLVQLIADGFAAYSRGEVVVPPVGEMIFDGRDGEAHIKYGFIRNDDYFVVKIATGFYGNTELGISTSNGVVLVFSQLRGTLDSILLDEGRLTDVRTAVAGAVAARALAPSKVRRIGIVGAGIQAKLQLHHLKGVTDCRSAIVWGRDSEELAAYSAAMSGEGFEIETTLDAAELAASCNLIVTATPSRQPLLSADDIQAGTHITAVGSDVAEKIELDPRILGMADVVMADSLSQSESRGEIFRAVGAGALDRDRIVELGAVIQDPSLGRTNNEQITVADLTGVAVQDIQIAKAVLAGHRPA